MAKILKSFVALALVASPLPALAQTTDAPATEASASTSQGPQGASLWIGILMGAAVLALIFAHNDIFGDSNDKPASP